jgi:hypothetical protein
VRLNAFAAFPAKTGIALDGFGGVVEGKIRARYRYFRV